MTQANEHLREIVKRYCGHLPTEIANLTSLLEALSKNEGDRNEALDKFHHEVHRMAGAAQCMGFSFLGEQLGKIEESLDVVIERFPIGFDSSALKIADRLRSVALISSQVLPQNSRLLRPDLNGSAPGVVKTPTKVTGFREQLAEESILFADDDRSVRMLMRDILVSLGVSHVETVASGQEALEAFKTFPASLVITDWRMKPVSGLDLLRLIRAGDTELEFDCPVIFLTSYKTVKDVNLVVGEGASHFLVKPFSGKTVERAILQVLQRSKAEEVFL